MAVTPNTTLTSDINAKVREIEFISTFEKNWKALTDILGIMKPIRKQPGSTLKSYIAKVTLSSGTVAEGDEIPLSKATVTEKAHEDIVLDKYRKRVTIEAVTQYGAKVAVRKTDEALISEITNKVMNSFYTFIQTGTLTGEEKTFQEAIAMSIGKVKDKFAKMNLSTNKVVVFVNTMDYARYLGTAPITVQTSNGISYIKNFLNADTIIITSAIPEKKVLATPVNNLNLYYLNPQDEEIAELGLNYTVSNSPLKLIGVHKEGTYDRASGDTYAVCGMKLWAEYLDGIAITTINPVAAAKI